ncbi:MAG: hypothetical protein CMC37_04240 [Flavobacteriaceae bacterium]|nr:hypothetical protein [Flavobacteriaceae bacterium]
MKKIIVVFDGFCILCNRYVLLISERDLNNKFYFTTFQSRFIKDNYPKIKLANTVFVITEENEILTKSEAIIYCLSNIRFNKLCLKLIRYVPFVILDFIYNIIAIYRYKTFGKYNKCTIPKNISKIKILY